jgi:nitrile hydratase accessory protein
MTAPGPETNTDTDAARQALDAVPSIPRDAEGPVFREPWEAQAFALVLGLYRHGLFTWKEWTEALVAEIRRAQEAGDPDTGETYYRHWLAALERIVAPRAWPTPPPSAAPAPPGATPPTAPPTASRSCCRRAISRGDRAAAANPRSW